MYKNECKRWNVQSLRTAWARNDYGAVANELAIKMVWNLGKKNANRMQQILYGHDWMRVRYKRYKLHNSWLYTVEGVHVKYNL